jgi:hypothetical protein
MEEEEEKNDSDGNSTIMLHLDRAKSSVMDEFPNNDDDEFFQMSRKH